MAKYCIKCGKALPEGTEICPVCNQAADAASDAALFTRITAETEIWKETENGKKPKKEITESGKQRLFTCAGSVALAILAALVIPEIAIGMFYSVQ